MDEPTCALCGGPRSKKSTSGFCRRNPDCNRAAQRVADQRFHAAHPEKAAEHWAAYGPGYKERRAELDKQRREDPEFREKMRLAVLEYKNRPENAERVREYNRRARKRYLARADRKCILCTEFAIVNSVFCREHARLDSQRQYYARRSGILQLLAERQEMICIWCEKQLPDDLEHVQVDHIIPRASGLIIDEEWNYQALHRRCNVQKSGKITPQAIALAAGHGLTLVA